MANAEGRLRGRAAVSAASFALFALACASVPEPEVPKAGLATGLDRPFPAVTAPPATPEQVELGRLLFFDRVLSAGRATACADCHQPALAFSDGRPTSVGPHGPLPRNAPTLYNVAFKRRLFWDLRAPSLEAQAFGPLFSREEMGADPTELLARLRAIPQYVALFDRAFGADDRPGVTLENLARALAAFQRSLVSTRSRYDRWVRGERDALSAEEQRGFRTFRSINTRCFECHRPPTFDVPFALGIGVPSDDPGVGGVTGNPARVGQFAVPSLRNVGRTAPYMHDGSLATLEEVIDFYREGGGRSRGVPASRINGQVRRFDISDEEARELVAFLRALGDESVRPPVPEAVPSGLPVPGRAATDREETP